MSKVIIIGASGHGKVIADIIVSSGNVVKGFLDDADDIQGKSIIGFPVLGIIADYKEYLDCEFIIAIGDPYIRKKIAESIDVKWHTAVHPSAVISKFDTSIGEGTVIMANAVVNPSAKIGNHCIVNTSVVVEHDNVLKDYVHLSPNVTLAGIVTVGECTHIGAGASTRQLINIAPDCVIGVGSVIVKDITEKGVYAGVPARKISRRTYNESVGNSTSPR